MPLCAAASLATHDRQIPASEVIFNPPQRNLMYVGSGPNLKHMKKANSGLDNIVRLIHNATRMIAPKRPAAGPVAIWDGEPKRACTDHDVVYDQP
jgi:hypothetical protein